MSIQNIDPFTLHFNVKECFTGNPDAAFWFDFGAGSDSGQNTLDTLNITTHQPRGDDPDRRAGPPGRRLPGADPPDRDALDLRRGDQDAVHLRHVDAHLARPAGRPLDHPGRRRRSDRLRPRALVPAQHPLLVARGRRHREAAQGHRQDPVASTTSRPSRPAMAASCAARRPSRSTSSSSTTCSNRSTRSVADVALRRPRRGKVKRNGRASSRHARPSQSAAARGRARHLLAGRVPGAAPAGQDLSRLQRLFLIVGETASMLVETGHPKDFPITEGAAQQAAARPAAAEISLRHASGDAALRRARPRADALSGRDPRAATSATITSPSRSTSTACA